MRRYLTSPNKKSQLRNQSNSSTKIRKLSLQPRSSKMLADVKQN